MIIIALGTKNVDQQQLVQDVLASRHLVTQLVPTGVESDVGDQLIGRDTVVHGARNRATHALTRVPKATIGLGLEGGIDMTPEGMFLVCAVVARTRHGREAVGWGTPRRLPESVTAEITKGESFDRVIHEYRAQWKPVDVFPAIDIDELINRHASFSEALSSALNGLET